MSRAQVFQVMCHGRSVARTMVLEFGWIFWPALPDDPQGIRVASVIEFSVCLFVCVSVCLFVFLGKFSNFFLQYKATAVRAVISISYGSKEGVQGSLLLHQYIVT